MVERARSVRSAERNTPTTEKYFEGSFSTSIHLRISRDCVLALTTVISKSWFGWFSLKTNLTTIRRSQANVVSPPGTPSAWRNMFRSIVEKS
jgi:hypothetical protein